MSLDRVVSSLRHVAEEGAGGSARRVLRAAASGSFLAVMLLCSVVSGAQRQTSTSDAPEVTSLLRQGTGQAAAGELAEADLTLEKAHTLAPDNTDILASLGKVKARVGEVGPAIELFRRVTVLQPRSAEAHLDLALALADSHDLTAALEEVTEAQRLAPRAWAVHLNRARLLADLHRTPEAEAEFSKVAALAPSNADCYFYWALLEREAGNVPKQISLLQRLVQLQPRSDEAWLLLGNSFAYASRQADAIASWRNALAINPRSSQAVYRLSRALRTTDPAEAKKLEDDFAALRESSESLDRVKSLGNQGYAAMQSQNWPLAISTFKQAVALCANCAVAGALHKDLGLAYCHGGQLADGQAELELALHIDPNDPDTAKALAVVTQRINPH